MAYPLSPSMSNILPNRPRQFVQRRSFAIVASQYNPTYVQALVENARKELAEIAPGSNVHVYEVPGAYEIPLVVQELAGRSNVDAVIALGLILEGETPHAQLIGSAITSALMDLSLKNRKPVIHEVLIVRDEQQARARCIDQEFNRGIEAARAAVQVLRVLNEVKQA
jgi:6,7-dimethyl-8-ribityllumazine synthase